MKTGVIDVGGGLRGIYAAGVLDTCLEDDVTFDFGIGISAGSANLCSYAAGQKGRNYQFYTEYSMRKDYMGFGPLIAKHSLFDLDYIYSTLSNSDGENPLNFQAISAGTMDLRFLATDAHTGKGKYFTKNDIHQDDYDVIKASCAIPVIGGPYEVNGIAYFDGALADPVPVAEAFHQGCDRVVLILTKPSVPLGKSRSDEALAKAMQRQYPIAAEQLRTRVTRYNASVDLAKQYQSQGKAIIIAPDDTCGVDTLTRNPSALRQLYEKGRQDGRRIKSFCNKAIPKI